MTFEQWALILASIFFGVLFLIGAFQQSSKTLGVLFIHICLSLFFGSYYYYSFLSNPKNFIVDERIFNKETAEETIRLSNQINEKIKDIQFTDAFIVDFIDNQSMQEQNQFSIEIEYKVSRSFTFRCSDYFRYNKHPEGATNYVLLEARNISTIGDIQKSQKVSFILSEGTSDKITITNDVILASLKKSRTDQIQALRDLFLVDSMKVIPFGIVDFYYFSFTVIGAADLIAANTKMRVIVMIQIISMLVLIGFSENIHSSKSKPLV
jgi:hypothetical protein